MKKAVTIRIKPKITTGPSSSCEMSSMCQYQIQEREEREERKVERQEECYAEIQSLRCEIEKMKTEMNEMRQHMKQMLKSGYTHSHGDSRNSHHSSETSASDFGEWVNGVELTRQDLETMFECSDVVEWASKFIVADLKQRSGPPPYPLCAIKGTGSRNELLTYHGGAWKKITDQEFASTIVNKMFKKMLAIFTAWKNENYNRILTSEHFSTLYHSNYARILSFNENASKLKTKLFHVL